MSTSSVTRTPSNGLAPPQRLSVPERHQLAIARKTLTYSDAGARIMGGPTKPEARRIILRLTGRFNGCLDCGGPSLRKRANNLCAGCSKRVPCER